MCFNDRVKTLRQYSMTLNYLERITISNPSHMMSMADPTAIGVETLRIDSGCSLEKEFIELIHINS